MLHYDADFLRALQADPWSEAQRLIYADWLEEQGCTEQAEYLRLEHALGHQDITTAEYFHQETRLTELRKELPQAWLQAVQAPYGLVLEEALPPNSPQRMMLQEIANMDRRGMRDVMATIPCLLVEGLTRTELEQELRRLQVPRLNRGGLPRVALRPMASLRFGLRLEGPVLRGKLHWVSLVQQFTGLGSKKAIALVSSAPCILKYDLNQPDAQKWQAKLTGLGGRLSLCLQARPAKPALCRVVLHSFAPRFRLELEEQLLPYFPEIRRLGYDSWGSPDPLLTLPLVLKKCVWQDEAEEIQQRLACATGGEKLAEVAIEAF